MKKRIIGKLCSQTGASITFALLLFLVCAVIGSVVLTAGTAASGRMSQITEMDQRYYSVNSAARLIIELLEKDEIWVEEVTGGSGETYKLYIGETAVQESTQLLAVYTARKVLALGTGSTGTGSTGTGSTGTGTTETVSLTLTVTGPDSADELGVTVNETVYSNGDLKIAVKNNTEGSATYTITLYFMNIGGESSFQWKLYDIEHSAPAST